MSQAPQRALKSQETHKLSAAAGGWLAWLRQPVDGASLAVFRVLFGSIVLVDASRYWPKIESLFLYPPYHFKFYGFEWVQVWPGAGMYWHFAAMGLAALCIALGLFYRLASVLFFLLFTYMFLLDQGMYLNHFYLTCLLAFLMCWLPADRCWALGAKRYPSDLRGSVPRWAPLSLMLLMEVVLIYAGLVKINSDWLQGYPLKMWFNRRAGYEVIGPLLAQEWFALAGSYGAILLHLVGAPLLFFRRTRLWVLAAYVIFHLSNSLVWTIGIFPFLTIAGTLMFFAPEWPRALGRRLWPRAATTWGTPLELPKSATGPLAWKEGLSLSVIAVFLVYNLLMPLRPLMYPGNVSWTEEGHRFSWRMKLRDKHGIVLFRIRDPKTDKIWKVDPRRYLAPWQYNALAAHPDLIQQFAHHLAARWQKDRGIAPVQVFAGAFSSLNGRPPAPLIDPRRDLAATTPGLGPADWILPLDPKLRPSRDDVVLPSRSAAKKPEPGATPEADTE